MDLLLKSILKQYHITALDYEEVKEDSGFEKNLSELLEGIGRSRIFNDSPVKRIMEEGKLRRKVVTLFPSANRREVAKLKLFLQKDIEADYNYQIFNRKNFFEKPEVSKKSKKDVQW